MEHQPEGRAQEHARLLLHPDSTLCANGSPGACTWKSRIPSCSAVLMLRACIGVPIGSS